MKAEASISPGCLLILAVVGFVIWAVWTSTAAHAQPAHSTREGARGRVCRDTHRTEDRLACVILRETGGNARAREQFAASVGLEPDISFNLDAAAIGWALRNRARAAHRTLNAHLAHYTRRRSFVGRPWTGYLRTGRAWAQRPLLWPRNCTRTETGTRCRWRASWRLTAPYWRRALDAAEGILSGEIRDPCPREPSPVEHWGSDEDARRPQVVEALASGRWVEVDCGPTRNRHYRPRRR